ncbi:cytochrome C [Variovorax sp. WS11]|uniref:c-type cytochrome n=1 Tax=Variovorax sp. WS11 TaxID=1105204 RepID=UPI000D0CE8C7|nr:c-type cytochrome [Variovorax sp. WS11]NDZ15595.1 c-type cytochrome [Variovorax sp. WS11]PSL83353.1 cytochrome C [Variovorax sp. WS11]
MTRGARAFAWITAAAACFGLATPAGAQGGKASQGQGGAGAHAQRFAQLCAACHGANGRSEMPNTPVLAGQHSFYAITQLFLFREGRRANEAMSAVAKGMKDEDLRGFSDFIATLPPVPAPAPSAPLDAARMKKGQALAQEHKCVFCHGTDFSGGQQVPRIGGQREDYLQMTLHEFKAGKRVGYTMAMAEAVGRIPNEDLDTLAYYLARFPGQPPTK